MERKEGERKERKKYKTRKIASRSNQHFYREFKIRASQENCQTHLSLIMISYFTLLLQLELHVLKLTVSHFTKASINKGVGRFGRKQRIAQILEAGNKGKSFTLLGINGQEEGTAKLGRRAV